MKADELLEVIGEARDDHVLDAQMPHKKRVSVWALCAAVAACLCLILGAVWRSIPVEIPDHPDAFYSAAQLADLFPDTYGTDQYEKIYVPDDAYLRLYEFPETETLPIFRAHRYVDGVDLPPSDEAYGAFLTRTLSRFCSAMDIPVPNYDPADRESHGPIKTQDGRYWFGAYGNAQRYYFSFGFKEYSVTDGTAIELNGHAVQADQRQSDREILASLEGVKTQLFEVFGVSFSDAKVVREYRGYGDHGVEILRVYYYDEDAHPVNAASDWPQSDNLMIVFDNAENFRGDYVSDSILTKARIEYSDYLLAPEVCYAQIATENMIPLEEAEAMLYKGYVFGNGCPQCMAAQERISFRWYDHVGFEYVTCYGGNEESDYAIPFYAFYKKIGTAENGETIYAQTYVPAIEISGVEAYFEDHEGGHGAS